MPGYNRAELSAELRVLTSPHGRDSPRAQVAAAKQAAGDTGLARESGPETTVLSGGRAEVLDGLRRVIEASLDAGAREVEVRVEAEGDAQRFGEG